MVATKTPTKRTGRQSAQTTTEKPVSKGTKPAARPPAPTVSKAVEAAPKPEPIPAVEPAAAKAPEPEAAAVVEPAPEPVVTVVLEAEPEAEPEVAMDEDVDRLASLAEQAFHEAEAIAGEAAHNFQVAVQAATGAQGIVPALSGINDYLRRSVEINTQFIEQFATVRSPLDLVSLQARFLEEHRAAMLDFAMQWTGKKSAP